MSSIRQRLARRWPLRVYFVLLFVVGVATAVAAAFYVDHQADRDARAEARAEAAFSARVAAEELGEQLAVLRRTTAGLAANPQLVAAFDGTQPCTLTFEGIGGPDGSHLDVLRADGTVACSSRELTAEATERGYGDSRWFPRALRAPQFVGPTADDVHGGTVAIDTAPLPDGAGAVAAFVDVTAIAPELASQYGGGRDAVFLVTSNDDRVVVSRSQRPRRWAGAELTGAQRRGIRSTDARDVEGAERLYAQAAVPGTDWTLRVGERTSDVLAGVERLRTRQLQTIGAGFLVFLLAIAFVYGRVVSPIRRLSSAVRTLEPTEPDSAVPAAGPAEVATLGEDVNGLVGSVQAELVERRRAEESYRLLFQRNPNPMWVYDRASLRFLAVNDAAVDAYGYSRDEFLAMTIDEIRPDGETERLHADIAAADDGLRHAGIWRHRRKDGSFVDVEITSHDHTFDGSPARVVMALDVTERLALEQQLRQSQRLEAVGRLAGGVAHDFNNVLTVIRGYTDLLRADAGGPEAELGEIAAAADRAAALTRQLLAFSRQQVLQPRPLVVNDVVEGVVPMLRRLIGEDVELVTSLTPDVRTVLADAGQLEQVLVNLAVNARDAMPDGGRLAIQTANVELDEEYVAHHGDGAVGPHVLLSVADDGEGMDAETLAHAFEPFYTTKAVGVGTGLGLATVYGIVKQSGGTVWVYSEPGEGTTIKIYLPVTDVPVEANGSAAPAVAAAGSETILVAEDEEALRTLTARMLGERGFEVVTAESATDALRIVEDDPERFDLLLTDLVMPELSGRELAERVAAVAPDIRVLFMSGYSDDAVLRSGSLAEGAAFVEKPFTAQDLVAKIHETLAPSR